MSYPIPTTSIIPPAVHSCTWCGPDTFHAGICPRVKAISYHETGIIAHVEFDMSFVVAPDLARPKEDA